MGDDVNGESSGPGISGRKRGRSLARYALILCTIALVVVLAAGFTARYLIHHAIRLDQVSSAASEILGREVRAESIDVSAIYGLVLDNVTVRDTSIAGDTGSLILRARRVRIRPSWWKLLFGEFTVASVRVLDADLFVTHDRNGWNVLRLASEIAKRTDTGGLKPALGAQNVRIHVGAPGLPVDGWIIGVNRFSVSPDAGEWDVGIDGFNGGRFLAHVTVKSKETAADVEFEDLPAALLQPLMPRCEATAVEGTMRVSWSVHGAASDTNALPHLERINVVGSLGGSDLYLPLSATPVRLTDFRIKRIEAEMEPIKDNWSLRIDDLRTGGTGAGMLRISLDLAGAGRRMIRTRVEWEGPFEKALGMAPRREAAFLSTFQPHGLSAGHVLVVPGASPEIAIQARGMSILLPAGATDGAIEAGSAFEDIRGRISWDGKACRMDSMALRLGGDPLMITGHFLPGGAGDSAYHLALFSSGINVSRFTRFLPKDVALTGRVAVALNVSPVNVTGEIRALGNTLHHPVLGTLDLVSGRIVIGKSGRVELDQVAVRAGEGNIMASGELEPAAGTAARQIRLRFALHQADLEILRVPLDERLKSSGIALSGGTADGSVDLSGTADQPSARGSLVVHGIKARVSGNSLTSIEGPIKFDSSSFTTPGLTANVGDGSLRLVGTYGGRESRFHVAVAHIDATLFNPFLPTTAAGWKASGPVDAEMTVLSRGEVISATGTVTFLGSQITATNELAIQNVTGSAEIKADRVEARSLAGMYQGAEIHLQGTIPLVDTVSYALAVSTGRAKLEHFAQFAPDDFTIAGFADAIQLQIAGAGKRPQIHGLVRLAGATIRLPFLAAGLSDVRGDAEFAPDSFLARSLTFQTGSSSVRLNGRVDHFDEPVFRNMTISANEARLEDLLALIPAQSRPLPRGASCTGVVTIENLRIDGPLDRAKWNGHVNLKAGQCSLPGLRRGITEIAGRLEFEGSNLKATTMAGRLGTSDVRVESLQMNLESPYELDLKLAISDAKIEELLAIIPQTASIDPLSFGGRGTLTIPVWRYVGGKLTLEGTITDGNLSGFGMPFQDVSGSFKFNQSTGDLVFTDLASEWAHGHTRGGSLRLNLNESPPTFEAQADIEGVELAEVLKLRGIESAGYGGRAEGSLSVTGRLGVKDSVNGSGWLRIQRGLFEPFRPIDAISRSLRLAFLSSRSYETARGSFRIERGVIRSTPPDHFLFLGTNYTLEARGYVTLDGECAFNYACGFPAGLVGGLLNSLQINRLFSLSGEGSILRTAGTVTGRINEPHVTSDLGVLNMFGR